MATEKRLGRPKGSGSGYTPEIALAICEALANGQSLRSYCREDGKLKPSTVCTWLVEHKDFAERYARAREAQADALFEEALEIADDGSNDWMERHDGENVGYAINGEHVSRSRLRVDTRKWAAGKMRPAMYGDRQTIDVNRGVQDMTDEELLAHAREVAGRLGLPVPGE